jgi:hypothetical protein|tara:strand:+ start:41 stop:193 length:153 start_codon:yes stop_codon:yes gene_type:complete
MRKIINWELSLGTYKGILFGIRSYEEKTYANHVLYLPLVDLCLTVHYETT